MKLKRIMLEDLIISNYKSYGEFKKDLDNRDYDEAIALLEDILTVEKFDVVTDYKQAEKEGVSLYNKVEVRTQMLKDNSIQSDGLRTEYNIVVYSDVNLEQIAEVLQDVTIEDLESALGHYGTWQVYSHDGTYSLIECGR